jgi:hypothetical protein
MQTLTDNRQTRPLVREGAPQRHNSIRQTVTNIWSWEPEGARHQDILIEWPSVVTRRWFWLSRTAPVEKILDYYWKSLYWIGLKINRLMDYWRRLWIEFQLSSLWINSCCGWGTGTAPEPRVRGTSAVGNRYKSTGENRKQTEKTQSVL